MKNESILSCIAVITLALFMSLLSPRCIAQTTIADALKNNFKILATGCFGGDTYADKFLPQALISHPTAQETRYKKVSNASFGAVSTLIYEHQDINEVLTAAGSRFLSGLNILSQDIVANSDFTSLTYDFSCVSALKTALSAGLNPSPLFGHALNIQAGLNAEMSNSSNTGLVVLYGQFRSPFSMMIQDGNPETRMTAYSAIWKYYLLNNPAPQNPAYLDFLEGWLVSSTTAKAAADSLDVNASANVHALVVNADWSGSASVKFSSSFKSQTFDIYLVPKPGVLPIAYNYHMYALPKPASIGREMQQDAVVYPSDVAEVIPGTLTQFKVAIPGLDNQFCNTPQWDASILPPASVINSNNSVDSNGKTCVINITLQLPSSPGAISNFPITLTNNYYPINGSSISFTKNLKYRNATYPIVHLSDLPKTQLAGDKNITISLDIPIAVEIANGISIPSDIKVTQATLDCQPVDGTKPKLPTSFAMVYSYVPQPSPAIHSVFSYPRMGFPDATCTWSGVIDFTYNGTPITGKQISVPIALDHTQLPAESTTR